MTGAVVGRSSDAGRGERTRAGTVLASGPAWSWVVPRDGYRLALWCMLLLTLSRIHQHFSALEVLRPALLTAVVALGFALANPKTLTRANLKTKPARFMLALVILACISVPFGISIGNSGKFLLDAYFRVILAYVLITLAMRGPREISQFTWAFVISCGILSWMATSVFTLKGGRLGGMYMYDSNDVGVLLIMGIPLTLLAFETSKRLGKVGSIGILLWIGLAIARTGSRGAFLGILAMIPAFLIWARHIPFGKRIMAVAVIVGGMTVAAPLGYWEQMQTLTAPKEDYNWDSEQGRRKVAKRGIGYMMSRPITGLGVDNFSKAEWTISELAQDTYRVKGIKGSAAHNTWIQAGAEMGVPGMIVYIFFVFGTLLAVVRERRSLPIAWRHGDRDQRFLYAAGVYIPLAILGFIVTASFVSFVYMDPMYLMASLSAGFLVSVRRKKHELGGVPHGGRELLRPAFAQTPRRAHAGMRR